MRCVETHPGFTEGDIPLGLQAEIKKGLWDDVSWQHDALPSFVRTRSNLQLFVNRARREDRFEGPDAPRFCLQYDNDGGSPITDIYVGESWDEVAQYVAAFEKGLNS